MRNRSVMAHNFGAVPSVNHPRSVFNRSCGYKTTFDAGYLIPTFVDPILPGDSVKVRTTFLTRLLSAAVRPFMDNLYLDVFWFFVPYRLVWDNFKKHMGEQVNPGDSISFNIPQITSPNVAGGGIPVGHLFDYFGLPTGALNGGGASTGLTVNNFVGRSYNRIWNEWFRDENLQNSVTVDTGDGADTWSNYNLLKRGKRFDYFTSALPWVQKGTAVSLPLGTTAPVIGLGKQNGNFPDGPYTVVDSTGATPGYTYAAEINPASNDGSFYVQGDGLSGSKPMIFADLSSATAATINSLRQSITLQQMLERDARGGTRYIELVKSHFGVTSPDARQQRSELLATYRLDIKMHPVAQTGPASGSEYKGSLAGFGTGVGSGNGFSKSFTEHGTLMCLVCVTADLTYQQGMDRHWNYRTRYDHYWPTLATLGEQGILNKEIYANLADGTGAAQKDGIFGYVPRYDEYRFKRSQITGDLRSAASGSLDVWHLSQEFGSQPTLGATFIAEDPPLDRVITVPSEPHMILDAYFDVKHARCMPVFAVPGLTKL